MEFLESMFAGRMNRKGYIIRSIVVAPVAAYALYAMIPSSSVLKYLGYAVIAVIYAYRASITSKRLHDTGHKGTLAILAFIPVVSDILSIYLWFKKGNVGENIYGPDPNS